MARKRTTTATKPDDARAQRSIDALRAALLELIERKPFDQISIKDITETAGLSYPTFFRRFESKEELLEHIATEEVRTVLYLGQSAITDRHRPESAKLMCEYVQEHRKLWTALLTGASSAMRTEFMRVSKEIADSRPRTNPWIPIELSVPFVTSGIFEILVWWLNERDDYPIENVIALFNALIVDVAGRPRNIVLV